MSFAKKDRNKKKGKENTERGRKKTKTRRETVNKGKQTKEATRIEWKERGPKDEGNKQDEGKGTERTREKSRREE